MESMVAGARRSEGLTATAAVLDRPVAGEGGGSTGGSLEGGADREGGADGESGADGVGGGSEGGGSGDGHGGGGGDGDGGGGGGGVNLGQSVQSVPSSHSPNSLPGPPSSQPPSLACMHVSLQAVCAVAACEASASMLAALQWQTVAPRQRGRAMGRDRGAA